MWASCYFCLNVSPNLLSFSDSWSFCLLIAVEVSKQIPVTLKKKENNPGSGSCDWTMIWSHAWWSYIDYTSWFCEFCTISLPILMMQPKLKVSSDQKIIFVLKNILFHCWGLGRRTCIFSSQVLWWWACIWNIIYRIVEVTWTNYFSETKIYATWSMLYVELKLQKNPVFLAH